MATVQFYTILEFRNSFLGHLTLLPVALLCRKVLSAAQCNGVRLLSDVFKSTDSTSMKSVSSTTHLFVDHPTLLAIALLCQKVLSAAKCKGVRLLSDIQLTK